MKCVVNMHGNNAWRCIPAVQVTRLFADWELFLQRVSFYVREGPPAFSDIKLQKVRMASVFHRMTERSSAF